jgi:hypothetical protein
LSGIPTNDDVGQVDITVRVSDGTVSVDQAFQITVTDVNDAPEITSVPETEVFQGEAYSYTLVANDPDGDVITYSAAVLPNWLTFDLNSHILSGNPGDLLGFFDVTLRVTDGTETTDQAFKIEVQNMNDLPVIESEPNTLVRVGETYLYQLTATDDDGDALSFTAENLPSWLSFVTASNTAILSGVPAQSNKGSHAIVLKVSDGIGEVIQAYSLKVVDWAVGIEESNSIVQLVYPNPATDVVYFELAEKTDATITIIDITGVIHKLVKSENKSLVEVDVSDLADKMYFYKISVGERSIVGKLLID